MGPRARGDRLVTYIWLFTQDLANVAYFLEVLAVLEGSEGRSHAHARRVAVLLGAAEALRDRVGARVHGYYKPDEELRERVEHQARSLLGPVAFADSFVEGRALELTTARRSPPGRGSVWPAPSETPASPAGHPASAA